MDDHPDWEVSTRTDEPDTIRVYACTNYGDDPAYLSRGEAIEMANELLDAAGGGGMDDVLARIAHIIDHEAFDGDGTLGQQVARRLAPVLDGVWRSGYDTCHNTYVGGAPFEIAPTVNEDSSAFAKASAERNDEERFKRMLDRSSFGTSGAKAAMATVSDEQAAGVLARVEALRAEKAERRRAVFEVMDLEDELEQQERRHEL